MAKAHLGVGDRAAAKTALDTGLDAMRRIGSDYHQAEILVELGELAVADGDPAGARRYLTEALALYLVVEDPAADRVRSRLDELSARESSTAQPPAADQS